MTSVTAVAEDTRKIHEEGAPALPGVAPGDLTRQSVRFFPDLLAALRALSLATGESQNTLINDALRCYMVGRGEEIRQGLTILRARADESAALAESQIARFG